MCNCHIYMYTQRKAGEKNFEKKMTNIVGWIHITYKCRQFIRFFFFFSRQFIDFIPHKLYNQKLKLLKIWNEIICSLLNWLHLYSSSPLIKRFFYPFFYIQYTCLDEPAHPRRQAIISIQTIFNKILHFFIPSKLRASNVISRIILLDAFFLSFHVRLKKSFQQTSSTPLKVIRLMQQAS